MRHAERLGNGGQVGQVPAPSRWIGPVEEALAPQVAEFIPGLHIRLDLGIERGSFDFRIAAFLVEPEHLVEFARVEEIRRMRRNEYPPALLR